MKETVQLVKQSFDARLVHVSEQGIGLVSPVFLPPGALVDVELSRDPFSQGETGSFSFTGKIVYARPKQRQCQLGLSFVEIQDEDRRMIREFIASHSK